MGRGKIEIKRIENTSNRQVTYSKRRNGIIKKAKEITVLCDAHVSLIIIASNGKMHEYCSPSSKLIDILEMYHRKSSKRLWDAKHENLSNEVDRIKKENDSMQIKLRHLKGEDITSLNHKEVMAIEETLENGCASVRNRRASLIIIFINFFVQLMIYITRHQLEMAKQQEMAMEGNVMREMDFGYHQSARDYNPQMPFAFRVQPIQPNLQERM
ncbi:hypothetical protein L1049_027059 [Liquidambar formosana]|uniref:Uncharacterized protein n=1 Tax=Liquidambar formosana TaxID=63359 RepID=A0AAP0R8I1_LIQFO